MFCESCGQPLSDAATICTSCGEPTTAGATPNPAQTMPKRTSTSTNTGSDLSKDLEARSKDVWQGVKQLAMSPVGGLPASYKSFGEQRALWAAIGFTALYLLFLVVALYGTGLPIGGVASLLFGAAGHSFAGLLRLLLCGLITVFTLAASASLVRLIFHGKGTFVADYYIASASLLPIGAAFFLSSLVGVSSMEIVFLLLVFAMVYNVLMLYSGCSRILGISEVATAPAVPIMMTVTLYLTKVVLAAILF